MVKLKFIIRDGSLVLRISENKDRYYKSPGHLLQGNPNIQKHWNGDKERFTCYAVNYEQNNLILDDFKAIFLEYYKKSLGRSLSQIIFAKAM
ncbi:MAG: hypothetical protein PUB21_05815 [Bacteroidales bacterium]|nr:hypothetical protein [Bacteroidales bacterium]